MTLVILDTNILVADYWLRGTSFRTLMSAANQLDLTIGIPALVVDELKGNFQKHATQTASELHSASRKWRGFHPRYEPPTITPDVIIDDYQQYIDSLIEKRVLILHPYPDVPIAAIVRASYAGKKPFKPNGDGYKDFILAHVLAKAGEENKNEDIVFISHNHHDFADKDGNLHPEIKEILPADMQLRMFSNLSAFVDDVIKPQLEALEDFAGRLEKNAIAGIDFSKDGLRDLFEEFVDGAEVSSSYLKNLPDEVSDATIVAWGIEDIEFPVEVRRLGESTILISFRGNLDVEVYGFLFDTDYYTLSEEELDEIYVSDPKWNDRTYRISASGQIRFQAEIMFDEKSGDVEATSFEFLSGQE